MLDMSKVSPAPWWYSPTHRALEANPERSIIQEVEMAAGGSNRPVNDLMFCALARNAEDVMARRRWGVVKFKTGWAIAIASMELFYELRSKRWDHPFLALVEADALMKAEGK